jgi:hypothetical protein
MALEEKIYRECLIPKTLSFDEESLFWRLRTGEGIPHREWHKPLDRSKSWHEIKQSLDQKLEIERTKKIFAKVYPKRNYILRLLAKLIQNLKIAFLLTD